MREIDAKVEVLEQAARAAGDALDADLEGVAIAVSDTFTDWPVLQADEKREILGPLVRSITIARAGRRACRVVELDLVLPEPDGDPASYVPPSDSAISAAALLLLGAVGLADRRATRAMRRPG